LSFIDINYWKAYFIKRGGNLMIKNIGILTNIIRNGLKNP